MGWELADIRRKVRNITGRKSTQQLTNAELDDYINDYYVYDFPAELKTDKIRDYYDFITTPEVKEYDITGYVNVQPNIYIEGLEINYYQDVNFFLSAVPSYFNREKLGVGDAVTVAFSGTLSSFPLASGLIAVTDDTEVFSDSSGSGTLTGSLGGTGTIDYSSGAYSVTFNTAPADGQTITASYAPYTLGRPTDALVFNETISFYPVPDSAYQVRLIAYKTPTLLSSSSSTPILEEWGPLIAIGAARQIFLDNGETERLVEIEPFYRERQKLVMRRTIEATNSERAAPRF